MSGHSDSGGRFGQPGARGDGVVSEGVSGKESQDGLYTHPGLDLEAIKARCEAATAGPWNSYDVTDDAEGDDLGLWVVDLSEKPDSCDITVSRLYFGDMENNTGEDIANADFVGHARSDVPALVAEVERQAVLIAELREAVVLLRRSAYPRAEACPCGECQRIRSLLVDPS